MESTASKLLDRVNARGSADIIYRM